MHKKMFDLRNKEHITFKRKNGIYLGLYVHLNGCHVVSQVLSLLNTIVYFTTIRLYEPTNDMKISQMRLYVNL